MLKPLDLTVLAFLRSELRDEAWTQQQVAHGLQIAQSSVHRALQQLKASDLLGKHDRAFREVLVHAVRHVYPPVLGAPTAGVLTSGGHRPLSSALPDADKLVWPHPEGPDHGTALVPLHPCVPGAALAHPRFHSLMALIDVLRVGRVRERATATWQLDAMLHLT